MLLGNPNYVSRSAIRHRLIVVTVALISTVTAQLASAAPGGVEAYDTDPARAVAVDCNPNRDTGTIELQQGTQKVASIQLSATGYGAPPPKYYPDNQRRLMAMRASRIDAYRAMAEVVNGLHIWGGTTIGDMVVQKDQYRVFLDAYVRGARIVNVTANEDGNYETVVELHVDDDFLTKLVSSMPCGHDSTHITYAPTEAPTNFYYSE